MTVTTIDINKLHSLHYSDIVKILKLPRKRNNDPYNQYTDRDIYNAGYRKCSNCQHYAHVDFMHGFYTPTGSCFALICDSDKDATVNRSSCHDVAVNYKSLDHFVCKSGVKSNPI